MKCDKARHLIDGLLDEELSKKEHDELKTHLKKCPDCLEEYDSLIKTISLIRGLEEVSLGYSIAEEVMGKLPLARVPSKQASLVAMVSGFTIVAITLLEILYLGSMDWFVTIIESVGVFLNGMSLVFENFTLTVFAWLVMVANELRGIFDLLFPPAWILNKLFGTTLILSFWLFSSILLVTLVFYLRKKPIYVSKFNVKGGV